MSTQKKESEQDKFKPEFKPGDKITLNTGTNYSTDPVIITLGDEIEFVGPDPYMLGGIPDKGAMSHTESDYKQFEEPEQCGGVRCQVGHTCFEDCSIESQLQRITDLESDNKLLREENKHLIRKYVNHEEINAQLEQSKNLAIGLADNAVNDLKGEKACAEYWSKIGIEVKNIIDSNYSDKRKLSLINGVFEKYS